MPSSTYLLAQANNQTWPAYSFRVHNRPLPEACKKLIAAEVKQKPLGGIPSAKNLEKLKRIFPITNRGISVETAHHNLNILCHLNQVGSENSSHVGLTVLSWFIAAGFTQTSLADMCHDDAAKANLKKYVQQIRTAASQESAFTTCLVYVPLPVNTDVRFVTSSDKVQLFLCHEESAGNTIQVLFSLLLFYGLRKDAAPLEFKKYTEESRAGRETDPETPVRILKQMMIRITQVILHRLNSTKTPEASAAASLENIVPIAELLGQLKFGEKSGTSLSRYSEAVLNGLTEGLRRSSAQLQKALSDALYMLVGITPENLGEEMMCMVKFWREKGLLISSNVLSEISFMANNVYNAFLPALADKLRGCLASPPNQDKYVRRASSKALLGFLATESMLTSCAQIYDEISHEQDMLLCIPRPKHADTNETKVAANGQTIASAAGNSSTGSNLSAPTKSTSRRSDYDHDASDAVMDEVPEEEEYVLFRKPRGDDISNMAGRMSVADTLVNVSRGLYDATPQTVSARHLVSLDCCPWYGVLRVVPGACLARFVWLLLYASFICCVRGCFFFVLACAQSLHLLHVQVWHSWFRTCCVANTYCNVLQHYGGTLQAYSGWYRQLKGRHFYISRQSDIYIYIYI